MLQRTYNMPLNPSLHGKGAGLKVGQIDLCEDGAGGHFATAHLRYDLLLGDDDFVHVMELRVRVAPVTPEMTLKQICDAALDLGEMLVWNAGGMQGVDTTNNHWPFAQHQANRPATVG